MALIYDEAFLNHKCLWDPDFPECPERLTAILDDLKKSKLIDRLQLITPEPADRNDILLCHNDEYVSLVESTAQMTEEQLKKLSSQYDSVYFHPETANCAKLAVGAAVQLTEKICRNEISCGMALVRPPGHHAMKSSACGYSIFNNVAIAAKVAISRLNLDRVMIVDWDVHHGQATQQMFYDDKRVLYFSIHRYEEGKFWPHLKESNSDHIGEAGGLGYNVNVPINQTGAFDSDYLAIFHQLLLPLAYDFRPQLILVSCGFDASVKDPKGEMSLSPQLFGQMTHLLKGVCQGRLGLVLEGGYNTHISAVCARHVLKSLLNDSVEVLAHYAVKDGPMQSTVDSILTSIYYLKPYWKCFKIQSWEEERRELRRSPRKSPSSHPSLKKFIPCKRDYGEPMEGDPIYRHLSIDFVHNYLSSTTCLSYEETEMIKHQCMTSPNHPESPARITRILDHLKDEGLLERCEAILPFRLATEEELQLVHGEKHIEDMKSTSETSAGDLIRLEQKFDSVFFSTGSYTAALTAVGCLLEVVDRVGEGKAKNGLALIRPPGHHAEPDLPCGFCLFNNVAVAAAYAIQQFDYKRVLIVDWDVHHGNGIQSTFYNTPDVLYISLHRYDNGSFFPANSDNNFTHVGEDAGKFFNLNLPFSQGAKGDGDYLAAFLHTVMPVAHQFNPELVLISGGFDAAKGDPLGGYHLSPALYAHLTHLLMGLAGGRVILALEGGYNLTVIPECFAACLRAMLADPIPLLSQSTTNCSPAALQTIWDVNELWGRKWSSISRFAVKFPIKPSSPRRVAASKVETQAEPQSDRLDPDSFNLESLRDSLQS